MINKGYLTAKQNKESDEVYTPAYAVKPLLKYISRNQYTIWCPFDKEDSAYVIELRKAGHKVIATHIDDGYNFFTYEPKEQYDIIISNPPFSLKDEVLKRLIELNKPFAILLPLPSLQGQKRFECLNRNCQALIFDKRINFLDAPNGNVRKGVAFASIYICRYFLPKSLIFEKLDI